MRAWVVLALGIIALTQLSYAQTDYQVLTRATAPSGGGGLGGDFPAWVIDSEYVSRSELYLGESFYLVFDLTKYAGGLYVEIRVDGSPIAAGTVSGGHVYGYPMRIVEPIYEGKIYSYRISVYDANTRIFLGSSTVSYVEKYCPDVDIVDVTWGSFVVGRQAQVKVVVRNRGEKAWSYRVEISSTRGSLQTTSTSVNVGAGSTATATLIVPVASFQGHTDTMVVRVSCAGGRKYQQQSYSITVTPPRPGPFEVKAQPVEAKLGQQSAFTITLRNLGYDALIESITLSEGNYKIDAPTAVKTGGEASATVYFTPTRAGEYGITVKIRYRSPVNNEVYEDAATVPVKAYARLAVEAVDHLGRAVAVAATIGGVQKAERWLLPGTYRVEVPPTVSLGPGERLTFARWEGGSASTSVQVTLETNTVLKVVYNREYRIVINLAPALPPAEAWAREGEIFTYNVPQHVEAGSGARWALDGFATSDGRQLGRELRLTVSGPATVNALWHKEYLITVDCGEARCVSGNAKTSQWVSEGSVFTIQLAEVDQASERVRWRLDDKPQISLQVTGPAAIQPKYVKEYYVKFGYKIQTVKGVEYTYAAYGQWVPHGGSVVINPERLKPAEEAGVKYELARYEVDGNPASQQFTATAPHDVYVVWDKYYYVKVSTPVSTASGEGWYKAGSYATVSVKDTTVGFLVYDKFKKWVKDDGREYSNATVTLQVDKPTALTAVWEKDYTQALALAGGVAVGGLSFWKREAIRDFVTDTLTRRKPPKRRDKKPHEEDKWILEYDIEKKRVREYEEGETRTRTRE